MLEYENYGDLNPIEHGGIFIAVDKEYGQGNCFYVIEVNPLADEEDSWLMEESYIDLRDVSDQQMKDALDGIENLQYDDKKYIVSCVISYFGHTTFSDGKERIIKGEKKLLEELKSHDLTI